MGQVLYVQLLSAASERQMSAKSQRISVARASRVFNAVQRINLA